MPRICIVGLLAFAFSVPARAALINGDFETGDLTGWRTIVAPEPPGSASVQFIDGSHRLVLDTGLYISGLVTAIQDFTLEGKKPYLLSLDFSATFDARAGGDIGAILYQVASGQVMAGGVVGASKLVTIPTTTLTAVLQPGKNAIGFSVETIGDPQFPVSGTMTIDNIRLTQIPEPTTLSMIAVGLVAITLAMRRKRTAPGRATAVAVPHAPLSVGSTRFAAQRPTDLSRGCQPTGPS
jgi:hypothetical protein